jgi:hypothetical protein
VLAGLIAMGVVDGSAGVRRLRPALLAKYGLGEVLQEVEDRHAGLTVLSCGHHIGGGITEYRLRLNPEARAVVEAAINTASAPKVVDGVRDPRTVDQRRGDALVGVCRRATLHLPRLHRPRHLGRRPPHPALGRRREHRPGQSFAVYEGDASSMCAACCRLTALVTPAGVRWNRRLGSYDDALARGPTATPAA